MTINILDACEYLQDKWLLIETSYASLVPGHYLNLTCVSRSPQEQFELFKQGRTKDTSGKWIVQDHSQVVTNVDGYKVVGKHNKQPSEAIDVVVMNNQTGKETWEDSYYLPLGDLAKKHGLKWGGEFTTIKDMPHLETI